MRVPGEGSCSTRSTNYKRVNGRSYGVAKWTSRHTQTHSSCYDSHPLQPFLRANRGSTTASTITQLQETTQHNVRFSAGSILVIP